MVSLTKQSEISDSLYVTRIGDAIQLTIPAHQTHTRTPMTVGEIMQLSTNFYFLDNESYIKRLNKNTAMSCGYQSMNDATGRSLREVSKKGTADAILKTDNRIMRENKMKVIEEHYVRNDDFDLTAISVKFPWIDENGKTKGIFGCSMLQGYPDAEPIANSLLQLIQTGLLTNSSTSNQAILPGKVVNELYLTHREIAILSLLVRGKSAKMIANNIGLSFRTVEHYIDRLKLKMGAKSKAELIDKVFDEFNK